MCVDSLREIDFSGQQVFAIAGLRSEMNARFETQDAKFDALDREVANLATRQRGSDPH